MRVTQSPCSLSRFFCLAPLVVHAWGSCTPPAWAPPTPPALAAAAASTLPAAGSPPLIKPLKPLDPTKKRRRFCATRPLATPLGLAARPPPPDPAAATAKSWAAPASRAAPWAGPEAAARVSLAPDGLLVLSGGFGGV